MWTGKQVEGGLLGPAYSIADEWIQQATLKSGWISLCFSVMSRQGYGQDCITPVWVARTLLWLTSGVSRWRDRTCPSSARFVSSDVESSRCAGKEIYMVKQGKQLGF